MSRRRKALAAAAAVIASLAVAASASANTIVVNTATDQAFVNDGNCSLREALGSAQFDTAANGCTAGSAGADTITFAVAGPINLTADAAHGGDANHGPLLIQDSVTINGPSSGQLTINAPTGGQVLYITSGAAQVTLSHLDLEGAEVSENDQANGGGIFSDATSLTLSHVTVANNTVTATGTSGTTYAAGGGIYESNDLTLDHSVISDNTADADNPLLTNGEANASGGGVLSGGTTNIIDSTIDGNLANALDEHDDSPGDPGNAARTFAGGLASTGNVTITGSTISNNTSAPTAPEGAAYAWGGGVKLSGGTATVELSTIAGNRTEPNGDTFNANVGGGILGFGGTLKLQSSTVATNGPDSGTSTSANIAPNFAGLAVTAKNTIVGYPLGATSTNCDGPLTSNGFNIDSGTSCGLDPGTTPTDQEGVTPLLGSLLDNGGPTETMLPQPTSPVIDKGSSVGQTGTIQDQRGLPRPVDAQSVVDAGDGSDIGAVEVQAPSAPTLTTSDPVSPAFNDVSPEVIGDTGTGPTAAETASNVNLFSDSSCLTSVGSGSAVDFAGTGITALVDPNTTTTFHAQSSNDYGIDSPCSTSFLSYTVDSLGPVITIDPGPSDLSDHTPTFTFHGADASPPITFECSVDGAAFSACVSPFTSASLADGSHTFRVQGTDFQGTGGAPATRTFTITTPAPPSTTPPSTTPVPKKCKKGQKLKKGKCVKKKKHKK